MNTSFSSRRHFIPIEALESRIAPATLDVTGGVLTFTAGAGVANVLQVTGTADHYRFDEANEMITLTAGAMAAGFTGSGTDTADGGKNSKIKEIHILLGDLDDRLIISGASDALTADGEGGADKISTTGAPIIAGARAVALTAETIDLFAAVSSSTSVALTAQALQVTAVVTSPNGRIDLTADSLSLLQSVNAGAGTVTIQPLTPGGGVTLGTGTSGLVLTDGMIDFVSAATLRISGGAVDLNAAITPAHVTTLSLEVASIAASGGGMIGVQKLAIRATGDVDLTATPNDLGTLAAAAANVKLSHAGTLTIGTVDGLSGIAVDANSGLASLLVNHAGSSMATTVMQTVGGKITGASLQLAGAAKFTLTDEQNDVGQLTVTANGARYFDKNDLLLPGQALPLGLTIGAGGLVTQSGPLTGDASLTFAGPGVLQLTEANTYTGGTFVMGGMIEGVGVPGSLMLQNNGRLAPGPGHAHFQAGNTSFTGQSSLSIQIDGPTAGTDYDVLDVNGPLTLGGVLRLSGTYRPPVGTKLVIVNNGPAVSGTFLGLPEGHIVDASVAHFTISYVGGDGNDIELTSVAPSAAFGVSALNAQLAIFAAQKNLTPAAAIATNTLTAKADDLVYAVYALAKTLAFDELDELTALVQGSLLGQPGSGTVLKVRADKDKIASRIFDAAIIKSGLTNDAGAVSTIAGALANVNAGTTKTLTAAGKEALIGEALKTTAGSSASVLNGLADLTNTLSSAVSATKPAIDNLRVFSIAAIKAAGTKTEGLRAFSKQLLTHVGTTGGGQSSFTKALAEGVVKVPAAAGAVYGAFADTLNDATLIQLMTQEGITDAKLAGAIADIVGNTASATAIGHEGNFANSLVTFVGMSKATTATRAKIASGAIQAINSTNSTVTVGDVITKVLSPFNKHLTKAELATFAGTAAVGTGDLAPDVVLQIGGLSFDAGGDDVTTLTNVGKGVLKAIAPAGDVAVAKSVAAAVADSSTVFGLDIASRTTLAKALATAVPTNAAITGGAVAGIGAKLNNNQPTPTQLSTFAAAVIPSATKAALNIAKEVAGIIPSTAGAPFDYATFAKNVAISTAANAPAVAAGVALAAAKALGANQPTTSGQTAGDITNAVAQASPALQAKLLTIAGSVALAVDVESIPALGGKVASLLQNTGSTSKLPKLTSMGTLATSLGKAINTKPLTGTANRVDELGELAAELTRAAINVLGPNATAELIASTTSSVGTSVGKALSSAFLIDAGLFAADAKDATRDIAGAIAQTISVMGSGGTLISAAKVNALLSDTGTLAKALAKSAKTFSGEVITVGTKLGAFGDVRFVLDVSGRLVPGTEPLGVAEVATGTMGRYEIGSLVDPGAVVAGV